MKVLFAISTEKGANQIIEFYKSTYGEKIEATKVFFFRSLLETLRKNKDFDRIVIHEELEPTGSKNQDAIDKYLFNNLDKVTDEAGRADIIIICTERRQQNDKFVKRLFNLGIYNVLTGQDRTVGKVSELINRPRTKKDAKMFVDVDLAENPYESVDKVDEMELRNIIKYYERNVFSDEKIVAGFESLYEQYNFEKLKQIVPFLPTRAREVLQMQSEKYLALMSYAPTESSSNGKHKKGKDQVKVVEVPVYINQVERIEEPEPVRNIEQKKEPEIQEPIKSEETNYGPISTMAGVFSRFTNKGQENVEEDEPREKVKYVPVVETKPEPIKEEPKVEPVEIKAPVVEVEEKKPEPIKEEPKVEPVEIKAPVVEVEEKKPEPIKEEPKVEPVEIKVPVVEVEEKKPEPIKEEPKVEPIEIKVPTVEIEEKKPEPVKEEPKVEPIEIKVPVVEVKEEKKPEPVKEEPKVEPVEIKVPVVEVKEEKKPEPVKEEPKVEPIEIKVPVVEVKEEKKPEPVKEEPKVEPKIEKEPQIIRPEVVKPTNSYTEPKITRPSPITERNAPPVVEPTGRYQPPMRNQGNEPQIHTVTQIIEKEVIKEAYEPPRDYKKVVSFIGAHKTGTTFIITAVATALANKGIKVAILDLTKNKDTYTIFTGDDTEEREISGNSLSNLVIGQNRPLVAGNISIYTGVPRTDRTPKFDVYKVIENAKRDNSVVLIDCDFVTSQEVFRYVQTIYVVQDMDILNVLPITMFLKELKSNEIDLGKVSVIVNKHLKMSMSAGKLIDMITYYVNPEVSVFEELLPKNIRRFIVPFDEQNYLRYMENLCSRRLNFSGFSDEFKQAISIIVQDVFPIGGSKTSHKPSSDDSSFLKGLFKKR